MLSQTTRFQSRMGLKEMNSIRRTSINSNTIRLASLQTATLGFRSQIIRPQQYRTVVYGARARTNSNINNNNNSGKVEESHNQDGNFDLRLEIQGFRDAGRMDEGNEFDRVDRDRGHNNRNKDINRSKRKQSSSSTRSKNDNSRSRGKDDKKSKRRPYDEKVQQSLDRQISMIEQFTSKLKVSLGKVVDNKKQEIVASEVSPDITKPITEETEEEEQMKLDEDADQIYKSLMLDDPSHQLDTTGLLLGEQSSHKLVNNEEEIEESRYDSNESTTPSLFPSSKAIVELPETISVKVKDSLKYLANKETANWVPVIDEIYRNEGFRSVKSDDVVVLLNLIPKKQKPLIVEKYHQMVKDAGTYVNRDLANGLMAAYNLAATKRGGHKTEIYYSEVERLYDYAIREHSNLKISTFGIMINTYAKQKNITKIKEILGEIDRRGLKPSMVIYTTILQAYIRMNNYQLAKETFQAMKFLSLSTSPSPITYTSMILMDIKNDNIEHALNLYDEMIESQDSSLKPTGDTLLAMARACANRSNLYEKGWSFIMEYYRNGYEVNELVIEIMMKLAKEDGDLEFVRSLYLGISETRSREEGRLVIPGSFALRLLFKSYAFYDPKRVPVTLLNEEIQSIRLRTMELANYDFHPNAPPLLPMTLKTDRLILAEADAMWSYTALNSPQHLSVLLLEDYLTVYMRKSGSIDKFVQLFEKLTFFQNDADNSNEGTITIEEVDEQEQLEQEQHEELEEGLLRAPALIQTKEMNIKLPRNDIIYMTCMTAARKFKNTALAQKIWVERGKYRLTQQFATLSHEKQDEADFRFAKAMLRCLVECGAVIDGYKLVLSSQNRFVWTYYNLKPLLILAETGGYESVVRELHVVLKKANKFMRRYAKDEDEDER